LSILIFAIAGIVKQNGANVINVFSKNQTWMAQNG